MSDQGSVSAWISELQEGDARAAQQLWDRFSRRLLALARKKLEASRRRVSDEEDVVICVFDSLFRRAQAGHFSDLQNRDDLWRLLVTIAGRKAENQLRHERAEKRQEHRVRGESAFAGPADMSTPGIHEFADGEPSPEFAVQVAETCDRLLAMLPDDELRQIAVLRFEGYTNQEIAVQIQRATATVERRLRLIRNTWQAVLS